MQGKIVFEGKSNKGTKLLIRYPAKNDALIMRDYINTLSQERTFIRFQGEKVTLEEETKYLNGQLKKIEENKAVVLLAFSVDKLIGISGIDMKDKTSAHEGSFAISITKDYRGRGIGKILMEKVIEEAKNNIPQLRIITLGVFSNNPLAYKMYNKYGFIEFGRLPEGILHKGKYIDHIYMYKKITRS